MSELQQHQNVPPAAAGPAVQAAVPWRLLDGAGIGVCSLTWEGRLLAVNKALCALLARDEQALLATTWQELADADDRAQGLADPRTLIDGAAAVVPVRRRLLRADGTSVWVDVTASAVRAEDGGPNRLTAVIVDVSGAIRAERQAAAAVREVEENFRQFAEALDDIILVGTPDGRILFSNRALVDKLGYTPEQLDRMHLLELHPAHKRAEAEGVFAAMLRGERSACRLPLETADGQLLPVETRVTAGSWNDGPCVFAVSKDLTKEQESLQRFDLLFNSNPSLMGVTDVEEGRYTEVNQAFLDTLGYSREEVIGHTAAQIGLLVAPEQRDELARRLLAEGRLSAHAMQVRCKDGSLRDGLFAGEVIELKGRRYFLTVMIDDTERLRAQHELRVNERRLRSILDTAPAIICTYHLPSHGLTSISRGVERILGYDPEALRAMGQEVGVRLLEPSQAEASWAQLDLLRQGQPGQVVEWEAQARSALGAPVWLRVRATVFEQTASGEPVSYLLAATDTSTEHRQQEELARSEERLRLTLDSLLDAVVHLEAVRDQRGEIIDFVHTAANKVARESFGRSAESLVGSRLLDALPGNGTLRMLSAYREVVDTGAPLVLDDVAYENEVFAGGERRYDVRGVRVGDGLSVMWRDVTARHEAEQAIRDRVAELDALQRITALLVRRVDLESAVSPVCDELMTLFAAGRVRLRLLPWSEVQGADYVAGDETRNPHACPAERGAILAALNGGSPFEAVCEDGQHVLAVPLRTHDDMVGVLALVHAAASVPFSRDEHVLAATIADLLAAVVQNERLHVVETQQAAERERQRLARDLHDSVTQNIYSANLLLEALLGSMEPAAEHRREDLGLIRSLIRAALAELRILVFELRPETLAAGSVQALLGRLNEAMAARSDVVLAFDVAENLVLPDDVRGVFYRVAQESVNNIAKHAHASSGSVSLGWEGDVVRLVVSDDGEGFAAEAAAGGVGFTIMRERAASIGADLSVDSSPQSGTVVTMEWRFPED